MDLLAYAQIDELDKIAQDNGIEVPRLRGYRLMKDEEPVNIKEELNELNIALDCAKELCTAIPFWSSKTNEHEFSSWTDFVKEYYIDEDRIRWERIHGWKRKTLKTYIHNSEKRYKTQFETFNKYAGREDVLYIHARIGGGNWPYYYKEVVGKPWFIEKVDDAFDSTYCDIYAKIQP